MEEQWKSLSQDCSQQEIQVLQREGLVRFCNTPPHQQDIVRFGPPSPPMSRASTQVPLTGLFLAVTHGPKTRLTSQGEHALIRPWLWTLASDVRFYTIDIYTKTIFKTQFSINSLLDDEIKKKFNLKKNNKTTRVYPG